MIRGRRWWRSRALILHTLAPIPQNLLNLLVIRHLRRTAASSSSAGGGGGVAVVVLCLLELLEEVPPLVGAHGRGPIETLVAHLRRNLLPQVLVRLGSVEEPVHLAPQRDEASGLIVDPGLRALLRRLDLNLRVLAAAAVAQDHLLLLVVPRWRREVGAAVGNDLDHHVSGGAVFFVEIYGSRFFRQVHVAVGVW